MIPNNINEQQLQTEIEQLKIQFPQTRDLYREACVLLFFRHGITPTANKLYQLVRRGSMSAPSEALNKFWLELREKSRTRIESPDIPEELKESAGTFISAIWRQAQEAAAASFAIQMTEANAKLTLSLEEAGIAQKHMADVELELEATKAQLENAEMQISELEIIHAVDINASATQEKALNTLLYERDNLSRLLEETRDRFSLDIGRLSDSLTKAENQYRSLEAKSLLELDKERQNFKKLERVTDKLRESSKLDQEKLQKEIAALQNTISDLKEKTGMLNGKIVEMTAQQKENNAKLKQVEKKLETTNAKLIQQTKLRASKSK
jgi:chromosome segregation ATPase